jgi:ubiquinone/menaquinone biosynthesis C-methylase UbiE
VVDPFLQFLERLPDVFLEQCDRDGFLAGKVLVQRTNRHTRPFRNPVRGGASVSVGFKNLSSSVKDQRDCLDRPPLDRQFSRFKSIFHPFLDRFLNASSHNLNNCSESWPGQGTAPVQRIRRRNETRIMKMTNEGNLRIYRVWAPVYDRLFDSLFMAGRKRAIQLLAPNADESLCIVGVGTGADFGLLPAGVRVTGIDLSPRMIEVARRKAAGRPDVCLVIGDAQSLTFADRSFDLALLNLILSVVPDPAAAMKEALRVVRPGGRLVVFDKFLPDGHQAGPCRRFANLFSTAFGTDINRRFGEIVQGLDCVVKADEPGMFGGMYRVILLEKVES